MTIKRLEISNPKYAPDNTAFYTLTSSFLNGRGDVSVYNINATGKNIPIILLLHGVYGSQSAWMYSGGAHIVYERLKQTGLGEFVLVMPSDGAYKEGSAYLPLVNDHGETLNNYEGWIVEDVLQAVIENTDCLSSDSSIYISGLSMGGFGALRLGAKHPKQFKGISAHSSVCSLEDLFEFVNDTEDAYRCKFAEESSLLRWLKQNKESLPPIRFDCGQEDTLLIKNQLLSKELNALDISHEFNVFPGAHTWDYWHEYVAHTFRFFDSLEYGK